MSKFNFNGTEISFSSETNDIIGIGDGLSLIVLSNDNNLLHVKIADTIDMIQDLSSFFSTIRDIQADDKETLSRAYSQINSLYKNDSEYNNLPIIITNKIDIETTIENSCEFIKDKDRFKVMYFFPITGNRLLLPSTSGVIKYESIVFFSTTDIENNVEIDISGSVYTFQQNKGELIINSRSLKLGEFTVYNDIKFEYIGFGSLYILMSNTVSAGLTSTGIGGDPYISNLQGIKYKIPCSNSCYNYIDNCEKNIHNRFIVNFETNILEGDELNELNQFILNQLMVKNNLSNIKEVPIWLFKNKLKLDMNACFIKRFYIKNGNNDFIFDLNKFKIYDITGNELKILPPRFKPVKSSNFMMINTISDHIKLNEHQPFKGLKIQTETSSFGTVTIEFMKYHHPQIRNNVNISFEKNPITTNSIGGIVKNRHYNLKNITSYPNEKYQLIENTVSEIYVGNSGKIKIEKIKQ